MRKLMRKKRLQERSGKRLLDYIYKNIKVLKDPIIL